MNVYNFIGGIADGLEAELPGNGGKKCVWVRYLYDVRIIRVSCNPSDDGTAYILKGDAEYVMVGFDSFKKTNRLLKDIDDCQYGWM